MKRMTRESSSVWLSFSRAVLCLLLVVDVICALWQGALIVSAGSKKSTSRAIAIVFDNSGSMYVSGETAWCRAIYAMEVFASMANEGDVISIYPMHEITVSGKSYTSESPLMVQGGSDVSVIRDIYTVKAGATPAETITEAYEGLENTTADEKWLIVLTDGESFYFDGADVGQAETETRLTEMLSEYNSSVNVMYLGIVAGAAQPQILGSYKSEVQIARDSSQVLTILTDMCNTIYGRDAMTVSGDIVDIDLSMTRMILFVQGSGIDSLALVDSSGNEVGTPTVTYKPSYSEQMAGNYPSATVDRSLSGMIVTYTDVPAGSYVLQYEGSASSVGVYYEPNVTIKASLVNENGINVTDLGDEVYPGTYELQYGLADEDGNLTDSALLGNREFTITYSINGEEYQETTTQNGSISIEVGEGDEIDALVEATYLSGYYDYMDSSTDTDWPFPLEIQPTPVFDLTIDSVMGGMSAYSLPELEEDAVYSIELSYDGERLTGEELERVTLDIAFDKEGAPAFTYEVADDGESILLYLAYPDGDPDLILAQVYLMSLTASYVEEYGKTANSGTEARSFEILSYDYDLRAEISADSYYVISKLENEPVSVLVTHDGEPLTVEEMGHTQLSVNIDGLDYTIEKDQDNSCFLIYLSAKSSDAGMHKIQVEVTGEDELGNSVSAADVKKIELQNYPLWLRFAACFLILLVLFLIVWFILNQKVLPKTIKVNQTSSFFTVDGDAVSGNVSLNGYKGGKKEATLTISSPSYTVPAGNTQCTVRLALEAVDPRKISSKRRGARVRKIANIPSGTIYYKLGTHTFTKDDEDGKFKKNEKTVEEVNVVLKNSNTITIEREMNDGTSVCLSVKLEYK